MKTKEVLEFAYCVINRCEICDGEEGRRQKLNCRLQVYDQVREMKWANYKPVIALFPQLPYVCLSPLLYPPHIILHSQPHVRNSTRSLRLSRRSFSTTALYSSKREIDVSPWIYGSITGDFETPRKQTLRKRSIDGEKSSQLRKYHQKTWLATYARNYPQITKTVNGELYSGVVCLSPLWSFSFP